MQEIAIEIKEELEEEMENNSPWSVSQLILFCVNHPDELSEFVCLDEN